MICLYIKSRLFCHYYWNIRLPRLVLSCFLFHGMVRNSIPRVPVFLFFVAWKGIPSCVLFRGIVRNGIPRICIFWYHGMEFQIVFSSAEGFGTELWEFASIFVPRKGIPSGFLCRGRVRNGIPRFSVPRSNRNSVGNNHLFRLFRLSQNYFFVGNSQPYQKVGWWGVIYLPREGAGVKGWG